MSGDLVLDADFVRDPVTEEISDEVCVLTPVFETDADAEADFDIGEVAE